ncbi:MULTISPECIES: FecR family protein [unclassified Saccharicrinis]|uniref:FecR family protein n=1 Tax=unclassified Saccharicrinis TaxID=2646859 RepID=UPI003D3352C8
MRQVNEDINLSNKLFLYLKDELSSEEKAEVEGLLEQDAKLNKWFREFRKQDNIDQRVREHQQVDVNQKWAEHQKRKDSKRNKKLFLTWMSSAASVIVILGVSWFVFQQVQNNKPQQQTVATITPGSTKAELIVEGGNRYVLPELQPGIIDEEGTAIEHNGEALSYQTKPTEAQRMAPVHTIVVPRGGEHQLVLADGTKVWLNAQSTLKFPAWFNGDTREVELTGEAYFDVHHNPDRPFIINTEKVDLEVLGTEFNIKAYEDEHDVATTLVDGKVIVKVLDGAQQQVMLKPGEQAVVSESKIRVAEVDTKHYTAWKDGLFIFKNESLEHMFQRMSRWYDFDIFFYNQGIKEYPFTGSIKRTSEIESILTLLEHTKRVKFEINNNTILVKEQ